jgi:hypothetical protein
MCRTSSAGRQKSCGRQNFYISCDPDEETLPYVAERVGASPILYHPTVRTFDGRFPNTVKLTAVRSEFSAEIQRKIPADNPARFIHTAALGPPFVRRILCGSGMGASDLGRTHLQPNAHDTTLTWIFHCEPVQARPLFKPNLDCSYLRNL